MLDKLYITPKQWKHILRWCMYALLLLAAMMLQTVILGNHTILGVTPDFVPVVIACVCMREGPERGGLFALLGSLFWYLSGADQGSISIAIMTIVPVLGSVFTGSLLINRYVPCLVVTFLTLFLQQVTLLGLGMFLGRMSGLLFFTHVLPCVILSLFAQPPVYWLVKRIERIGDPYESV